MGRLRRAGVSDAGAIGSIFYGDARPLRRYINFRIASTTRPILAAGATIPTPYWRIPANIAGSWGLVTLASTSALPSAASAPVYTSCFEPVSVKVPSAAKV